jgi:hypothetical protein
MDPSGISYVSSNGPLTHFKACIYTGQHRIEGRRQILVSLTEFEPIFPGFEQSKTVHATDRNAALSRAEAKFWNNMAAV